MSRGVAALYNATNRSAWAVAVCWVIVACATGHGGKFILTITTLALILLFTTTPTLANSAEPDQMASEEAT